MRAKLNHWDYLIVTASNEAQARAYESQLKVRQDMGLLSSVRDVMVVPDPGGKQIGRGCSIRSRDTRSRTTPPNERARFFDFDISNKGLTVTVS